MTEPVLVLVEWLDSNCESGWQPVRDALRCVEENTLQCETVGWLIAETDRYVALATSRGLGAPDKAQVCDLMQIPRVAVTKVSRLQVGRRRA